MHISIRAYLGLAKHVVQESLLPLKFVLYAICIEVVCVCVCGRVCVILHSPLTCDMVLTVP